MCSIEVPFKMAKMMIVCTQLSTKHSSQIRAAGTQKDFSLGPPSFYSQELLALKKT